MTPALKLFSSVMHGNDSVILCERYEVRDLTPNLSGFQKVMHSDVICDLLLNRRTVTCRRFLEYPLMDHFQFLILVNFLFYILLKYGEFKF